MSESKTLLPPNRSALERNLEAVTERSTDVEAPFNDLWDPWNCPARVLPWLAWALGVQEWSASWPESRRRSVVASAIGVRRKAGTAAAVREAVESLEIEGIEYSEWHEYGGDPGTYRITATLEQRGMTQEQYEELVRVIQRAGRLSAWLDPVGFTLVGRGRYYPGVATLGGLDTTIRPKPVTERNQRHGLVRAQFAQSVPDTTVRPPVVTSREQAHGAFRGQGSHVVAVTEVRPPVSAATAQLHYVRRGFGMQVIGRTSVYPI
ncbi:MAG: phage tail protein I [Ectothiorhodospiraceae bacterium]|nr:phage tail protein I [Ectothiorhodospiraceae bacterium]